MLLLKLKAVPRPVDNDDGLVRLIALNLNSENRAFVQEQFSPVNALKRSYGTSCAALPEIYAKLQRYGNAV